MKVVWTEQALARLIEIQDVVVADDPVAATALVSRLVDHGESLRQLWRRGRPIPELRAAALRELVDGRYRIVYRARGARIEILTVSEAHRRLPFYDLPRP